MLQIQGTSCFVCRAWVGQTQARVGPNAASCRVAACLLWLQGSTPKALQTGSVTSMVRDLRSGTYKLAMHKMHPLHLTLSALFLADVERSYPALPGRQVWCDVQDKARPCRLPIAALLLDQETACGAHAGSVSRQAGVQGTSPCWPLPALLPQAVRHKLQTCCSPQERHSAAGTKVRSPRLSLTAPLLNRSGMCCTPSFSRAGRRCSRRRCPRSVASALCPTAVAAPRRATAPMKPWAWSWKAVCTNIKAAALLAKSRGPAGSQETELLARGHEIKCVYAHVSAVYPAAAVPRLCGIPLLLHIVAQYQFPDLTHSHLEALIPHGWHATAAGAHMWQMASATLGRTLKLLPHFTSTPLLLHPRRLHSASLHREQAQPEVWLARSAACHLAAQRQAEACLVVQWAVRAWQ